MLLKKLRIYYLIIFNLIDNYLLNSEICIAVENAVLVNSVFFNAIMVLLLYNVMLNKSLFFIFFIVIIENSALTKKTKMIICKVMIMPILMYVSETMTLIRKGIKALLIFECKILRSILGAVKIKDNEYRKMMNF